MTTRPPQRKAARPVLRLRLYVAGDSPNSVLARQNLRAALAHLPQQDFKLELVDVLRDPERSIRDGVLLTPTLVKVSPAPERRVVGTLRDGTALLASIGIDGGAHG